MTKEGKAKWPYIANAVFRIVQNHDDSTQVTFVGFRGKNAPPGPTTKFSKFGRSELSLFYEIRLAGSIT